MKCPKCLSCADFAWWDGDYVCMHNFKILSYVHNKSLFDDDLIFRLNQMSWCPLWKQNINKKITEMRIEEFNKWNELHQLEKQLERHVK